MRVELQRQNDAVHFAAKGSSGISVQIDGSESIGGRNAGNRPMELLLMGLGGCTAIDVVQILKKQRQNIKNFRIIIDAERAENQLPAVFTRIHIKYIFKGDLAPSKIQRAIDLSFDKYCSASAMLGKTATIEHSFEIID